MMDLVMLLNFGSGQRSHRPDEAFTFLKMHVVWWNTPQALKHADLKSIPASCLAL